VTVERRKPRSPSESTHEEAQAQEGQVVVGTLTMGRSDKTDFHEEEDPEDGKGTETLS
jgi:hypothetical protein